MGGLIVGMVQHCLTQGNTRTSHKEEHDCRKTFRDNSLHALQHGFVHVRVLPGSEPCLIVG